MAIHFEWRESMSVGEATIDAQHKRLLSQVNTLIDAMVFGITSKEVVDAIAFFELYINEHLEYEENYMQKRGYADLDAHKAKHQEFRVKYADFKKKLDSGTTSEDVLIEIEEFLGQWWVGHIGYEDKKYHEALGAVI